MKKIKQYNNQE